MPIRAVLVGTGEPRDVVRLEQFDAPEPGAGEIRVRVDAAAINPADFLRARGQLGPPPAAFPVAFGSEGTGVVERVGPEVATPAVGDRVLLPNGVAWTEVLLCRADAAIALHARIDKQQAAMLSINPATAALLLETAGLTPGDWFIFDAALSAVGRLLARVARTRGLRSCGVVRRLDGEPATEATEVLVDGPDLAARVRKATGGAPIRAALDAVAGDAAGRLVECLAPGGTLVVYGLLSGPTLTLPAARIAFEGIRVRGFSRLGAIAEIGPARASRLYDDLARGVATGELASEVEATYPLGEVQAALAHAERAGRTGKIVLLP